MSTYMTSLIRKITRVFGQGFDYISIKLASMLPGYNAIPDSRVIKIPIAAVRWNCLIRVPHLH